MSIALYSVAYYLKIPIEIRFGIINSLRMIFFLAERHFQRMNRLLQQAMFVEHTWQMMRRATAPTDSM